MNNTLAISKFELVRIFRNRRLLLLVLSQPLVIAIITGLLAYQDPSHMKVQVVVSRPTATTSQFIDRLRSNKTLDVLEVATRPVGAIARGELRAVIEVSTAGPLMSRIEVDEDPALGPSKAAIAETVLSSLRALGTTNGLAAGPKLEFRDLSPHELHHFDYFASGVIILLTMFVVLNLSAISITSERSHGTFERLAVTPYSKLAMLSGKAMAHITVGITVPVVATASFWLIYHITLGNLLILLVLNLLTVLVAVALGLLISAVTRSVTESVQLAMYTFFIVLLTCGFLAPLETAQPVFARIIQLTPFYYAVDAMRRVNMMGADWSMIARNLEVLGGFLVLFLVLATTLLQREER